jgi:DNA-binding FadR family transcriptional regulator
MMSAVAARTTVPPPRGVGDNQGVRGMVREPVEAVPGSAVRLPVWRPVRGGNAFEITVSRLAQAIRLGAVGIGERLPPERELADRLQVSRVTLREAIRALREAGFLESRRGRTGGTFVVDSNGTGPVVRARPAGPAPPAGRPGGAGPRSASRTGSGRAGSGRAAGSLAVGAIAPSGEDPAKVAREMGEALYDALDFRRVLEPGAAELAAARTLSAADRQHLVSRLTEARERGTTRRVNDSRLHLAIATASGCPSLAAAVADVQLTLDRLLAAIPVIKRNLDHSDSQHDRIVDAILHGDPHAARTAMREHCDGTAELLRGLLG